MKRTDDINAKLDLWAARPRVMPLPRLTNLPRFGHCKFNSYRDMNAWTQSLLADLLASKVSAGRPQDLQDAEFLQRLNALRGGKRGAS